MGLIRLTKTWKDTAGAIHAVKLLFEANLITEVVDTPSDDYPNSCIIYYGSGDSIPVKETIESVHVLHEENT